jgi:peroxiredoxin
MGLTEYKPWMTWTLRAAALYNLAWGALVVFFPLEPFRWLGMEPPLYPEIWQCLGMVVGVYGVGYALAAGNPYRHWPIVFVGLLGKILGPLGFYQAAVSGRLPWAAGWTILTNDLVWWLPFGLILHGAWKGHVGEARVGSPEIRRMALRAKTQHGVTLEELSQLSPVLLVFLRHRGCPFCREALADLAGRRREIEELGTRIVLVHMSSEQQASSFFSRYGLEDLPRVSDPERSVYRAFGLGRGAFLRLFGPAVWWRGVQAFLSGHRIGRLVGDGFQMPGVFLVFHGEVLRSYRHYTAADRPDYMDLACIRQFPA